MCRVYVVEQKVQLSLYLTYVLKEPIVKGTWENTEGTHNELVFRVLTSRLEHKQQRSYDPIKSQMDKFTFRPTVFPVREAVFTRYIHYNR